MQSKRDYININSSVLDNAAWRSGFCLQADISVYMKLDQHHTHIQPHQLASISYNPSIKK